ncbi:Gfo/Idh/MocA family protein [Foetidibacter luteolus]|uniref:Gfo/Idh/MocA family protein n=1 Tax=Foetidibacter luteolus TaxID=2608880 RepID=UPI00129B1D13|nr:Gfo/Idh/MocA family oxidoreductase [Foetidibacter luteolus]
MRNKKSLGIAIAGLGEYAETQIIPALELTPHCELAAVITDDSHKKEDIASKYNLKASQVYYYDETDKLKDDDNVQLTYVITPNKLHREHCEKFAASGKHVLCEKPMAVSAADCEAMIEACRKNNVRLFIGYRLHFEPHHRAVKRICRQHTYGPVQSVSSSNGFYLNREDDWRLNKQLAGGGAMMDMGIYIVNAYRQLFQQKPVSVYARKIQQRPDMFKEVEESLEWEMHYSNGITAKGYCSYNSDVSDLNISFASAELKMENAYKYEGIQLSVNNNPLEYETKEIKTIMLEHVAECIRENKASMIEPEEGLQDIQVIEAVYRSIQSGKEEKVHYSCL